MPDVTTQLAKLLNYLTGMPSAAVNTTLFTSTAAVANSGTGQTDLITYTMPANALNANGQKIRITAGFICAANGDTKTAAILFGGTTLVSLAAAANGTLFVLEAVVVRTGAAAQVASGWALLQGSSLTTLATSPTIDTTAAIIVKIQGTSGTQSSDITSQFMTVEWMPANP